MLDMTSSVLRPAWTSSDEGGQFEAHNHKHTEQITKNFYIMSGGFEKISDNFQISS